MPEVIVLIGLIKRVEYIGFTIQPYLCSLSDNPFLTPVERIHKLNINTLDFIPNGGREIYEVAEKLEPDNLIKRFSKNKKSIRELIEDNPELTSSVIIPFISKKLSEIIEIITRYSIPLFDSVKMPHLYPADRIIIQPGKAKTSLNFERTEDKTIYHLEAFIGNRKIDLKDKSNFVLINQPCYLFTRNRLVSFERNITGKQLQPFFTKDYIEIPKRLENKYFSTFIRKIINTSDIKATGFDIKNTDHEPSAILAYDINWQQQPCLVLKFIYGEKTILSGNPQKHITDLQSDEKGFTFYKSSRNMLWEDQQKQLMTSMGLIQFESCFRLADAQMKNNKYGLIEWLTENYEKITDLGFQISMDVEKPFVLTKPLIKQQITEENDWFDLKIHVKIGNFDIPFLKFRNHILQNIREYELPDGSIFLIPEMWFDRYRQLMIHVKTESNSFSLHKHHYNILKSLDLAEVKAFDFAEVAEELDDKIPALQNVTLRPYQVIGYRWMKQLADLGFGGILADDMGLGKTLQTITLLASYYDGKNRDIDNCSLLVMPSSLIHNWSNELNKFAPHLKILIYTGTSRKKSKSFFKKHDLVLTTYGTLRNDIEFLKNYNFQFCILDESQQIKNPSSKTAQAVSEIQAQHRFVLTGTPVENNLTDLWSQMNFVNPGLLGTLSSFTTYYTNPLSKDPESEISEKLLGMINPFILRRTKESVAPELPELMETISYCTMTEEQNELYESEKSKVRNLMLDQIESLNINSTPIMVLKALMQLRQLANHPKMIDPESKIESGKFEEITGKLETIIEENHKVLIFSSFVKHLNLIAEYCRERNFKYSLLTGTTQNRGKIVGEFKKSDDIRIFLISMKAGGVGLNLTEADYVFMLDPWWNPAAERQAINRAHRIGQHQNVIVYRFITKNSIEEKILKLQEKKKALADAFIRPQEIISGMTKEELMLLFE